MRRFLAIFVAGVFIGGALVYAGLRFDSERLKHPPRTDAEQTLDMLLMLGNRDEGSMFHFVLQHPWRNRVKDAFYKNFFTPTLLQEFAQVEKEALQESCGGKYIDGDLCGLAIDPITCSQDPPESYHYRTLSSSEREAVIHPIDDQGNQRTPTYRLAKIGTDWKLDGIDCMDGMKFNTKESTEDTYKSYN